MKMAVGNVTTRDRRTPYADAMRRRMSSTFAVCSPEATERLPEAEHELEQDAGGRGWEIRFHVTPPKREPQHIPGEE